MSFEFYPVGLYNMLAESYAGVLEVLAAKEFDKGLAERSLLCCVWIGRFKLPKV